jgi:hypothetical protein
MSATTRRVPGSAAKTARQGRRQAHRMTAALTIRSQATPSGSTRVKSRTANAGPR